MTHTVVAVARGARGGGWRARAHREAAAMSGASMDAARPSRSSFISTSVPRNSEESSDTCAAAAQSRTHTLALRLGVRGAAWCGAPPPARPSTRQAARTAGRTDPRTRAARPFRPGSRGPPAHPGRWFVQRGAAWGLTSCTTKDTRCPRATSSAPSRASGSTRSRSGKLAIMTCRGTTADELVAPSPGPGESSACASQRAQASATASNPVPISRM
jgi:hypothetical protein